VLFWMADQGRLGRKSNSGFYAYDEAGKRGLLWDGLEAKYPVAGTQPALADIQHRLLFAQALAAVGALEDGVLMDVREGDVGAILGWGFAPWSGGPLSWLDMIGAARAVELCEALAAQNGDRFAPPELLKDLAVRGQTFYGRFSPQAAAAA
jgi:3-hydroxyacyl-CoA dehydrogenase/enoyl-CoA hydratase/3-hydroxybutyryl-CoA epimerase